MLDISARVSDGGERGMLSLAFDPQFATNGNVFVYFTEANGDIAIERFTFPVPGGVQLPSGSPVGTESTAVRVLTISHHTFANHNGGQLQFGLDGMLYVGTGDGGGCERAPADQPSAGCRDERSPRLRRDVSRRSEMERQRKQ